VGYGGVKGEIWYLTIACALMAGVGRADLVLAWARRINSRTIFCSWPVVLYSTSTYKLRFGSVLLRYKYKQLTTIPYYKHSYRPTILFFLFLLLNPGTSVN